MNQAPDTPQVKALAELWHIGCRYRWRFIVPAFVVCALVLLSGFALPRKYKAQAIFERRTDMVLSEMTRRGASDNFQDPRNSMKQTVAGTPAIDRVVDDLAPELERRGILHDDAGRRRLRTELEHNVLVHWDISSGPLDRVRIDYTAQDPHLASLVVNGLVHQYIDDSRSAMTQRLKASAKFFQDQSQGYDDKIKTLEDRVLQFEIEHAQMLPQHPDNLESQLADARERLEELKSQRQTADRRVSALEAALAREPAQQPVVVKGKNPKLTRLEEKQRGLRDQLDELVHIKKMRPQHPDVVALRQQIAGVDRAIAGLDREVVTATEYHNNPNRQAIQLQLTTARGERDELAGQTEAVQAKVARLSASASEMYPIRSTYRQLTREVDQAREQSSFWADNLRRVQMALTAENGNRGVSLSFIRPASVARLPVSPNLGQVLLAAIGLGGLAGGLGVFFAYRSDQAPRDAAGLSRELNLPLMGTVSELVTRRYRYARRLRNLVVYPAVVAVMAGVLLGIAGVLYLDLNRPGALARLRQSPAAALETTLTRPLADAQSTTTTPSHPAPVNRD